MTVTRAPGELLRELDEVVVGRRQQVELDPVCNQIGSGRIADRHILEPLRAEPDFAHRVAGSHALCRQCPGDDVGGDGATLRPSDDQRNDSQRGPDQQSAPHNCPRPRHATLFAKRLA